MALRSRDEIFASLDKKAHEHLNYCGNCAQATFLALQEQFELEDGDSILKALTSIPGVALRGETCGVVIGSLMALGLIYGRSRENLHDFQSFQKSLPPARQFCRRFEKEVGSTMCGDIIESDLGRRYDLANPDQAVEWMSDGGIDKCEVVVRKGVHITAKIIMQ